MNWKIHQSSSTADVIKQKKEWVNSKKGHLKSSKRNKQKKENDEDNDEDDNEEDEHEDEEEEDSLREIYATINRQTYALLKPQKEEREGNTGLV